MSDFSIIFVWYILLRHFNVIYLYKFFHIYPCILSKRSRAERSCAHKSKIITQERNILLLLIFGKRETARFIVLPYFSLTRDSICTMTLRPRREHYWHVSLFTCTMAIATRTYWLWPRLTFRQTHWRRKEFYFVSWLVRESKKDLFSSHFVTWVWWRKAG